MPRPDLTPLEWSDDDLDAMAMSATPLEIAEAQNAFRTGTLPEARDLLDAKEQDDKA